MIVTFSCRRARFSSLQSRVHMIRSTSRRVARAPWTCIRCRHSIANEKKSTNRPNQRQIVFSGIQPTGVPHLGNYLGALRQWVKLQDEADPDTTLLYSIVDLHAITVAQDAKQLWQWKREMFAALLAVGLDPKRSIIFNQSDVPAHTELMWVLSCNASVGYLSRMTQWKSKLNLQENESVLSQNSKAKLKLGLFSYPVLQAADILVHRATHVPVGSDQTQHLEFAREVAIGFNHLYGKVLTPPETRTSPAKRVMSLTDPTQKMSKSHENPNSRILITDPEQVIKKKIKAAVTDSINGVTYDPISRPGVSNLIEMMHHLDETGPSCEELAEDCKDLSMRALKDRVSDAIMIHLAEVKDRYFAYMEDKGDVKIDDAAEEGLMKASDSAAATMKLVKEAVGLASAEYS